MENKYSLSGDFRLILLRKHSETNPLNDVFNALQTHNTCSINTKSHSCNNQHERKLSNIPKKRTENYGTKDMKVNKSIDLSKCESVHRECKRQCVDESDSDLMSLYSGLPSKSQSDNSSLWHHMQTGSI